MLWPNISFRFCKPAHTKAFFALSVLIFLWRNEAAIAQPQSGDSVCAGRAQASTDERIHACSATIASTPKSDSNRLAILHTNRGAAWREKGDFDRAMADQDEALKLQPGSAIIFFNRAIIWLSKNDADHAFADFGEAIQNAPGFGIAYRSRGDLLYAKKDFANSIKEYDAALRCDPKDFRALAMRGLAKWQQGDHDGGKQDLAVAMRRNTPVTVALISGARPVLGDAPGLK